MKRLVTIYLAMLLAAGAAIAQDGTTVAIPVGEWADALMPTIGALLMAAIGWGFRQLPERITSILRTFQVEQMLEKAKDYGINTVKGATKDKVLEVNVGNAVVAQAASYAVKNGPKWMIEWLGGEKGIRERILARLDLDANAGVDPAVILQGTQPSV